MRQEPERTEEEVCPVDFDELLSWRYSHRGAESLPSKLTATELKSCLLYTSRCV